MVRKFLVSAFIASLLLLSVFPNVNGAAAASSPTEDCNEQAHNERKPRPVGAIGAYGIVEVYDYSHLPDPQDIIFVCINQMFLPTDVYVEVENGSTLIPMRALLEALGAGVSWDEQSNTATVQLDGNEIKLTVDDPTALVNGQAVAMTVPARKKQDRVFVPLRFVSDQLGRSVLWEPNNKIVKVNPYTEISQQFVQANVTNNSDDYNYGNFFSPASRFLLNQGEEILLLESWGDELRIQKFSTSFMKKGEIAIPKELPSFGGVHAGEDGYYYVVYAQNNMEESDTKTVYRIVKYDRDWKKIDQADIQNVNVTQPLDASNLTMDSHNGTLAVYSGRERYLTPDGLHHQSNIPFLIRTDDMAVLYSGGEWPRNHVSHSFATYVKFDGDRIVYVDHGDAYPRSIVLQVEEAEQITKEINLISFPGQIGDNYTGAHVGGLEVVQDHYLIIGSYAKVEGNGKNVFLASVPKEAQDAGDVDITYLTSFSDPLQSVTETHLVKINDDRLAVLWREAGGGQHVYYMVIDGKGKTIKQPKKLEGVPSPGHLDPLVIGNKLVWYYNDIYYNKEEGATFYSLTME